MKKLIRNFCIIAHIDHGKSTLADRLLEITDTISQKQIKEQFLDQLDLERERGITIKMQPVRMLWNQNGQEYILNLIDTPGHVDFSYEVSRSLKAVEGAILLVDATQGVQAQTLSNIKLAQEAGLTIIPVINKIDMPSADIKLASEQIQEILKINNQEILHISAKTGEGVKEIIQKIIQDIPAPKSFSEISPALKSKQIKALIFDSLYDSYKGVIAYVRVFEGEITQSQKIRLYRAQKDSEAVEVGYFSPQFQKSSKIGVGEIGYVATNLKTLENIKIGDTITLSPSEKNFSPISGYREPQPMVFASFFPIKGEGINALKISLEKFQLSDSAFQFEPETSYSFGTGFRCSFLGLLHMEIVAERLKREFGQELVVTSPSVSYNVILKNGETKEIQNAENLPDPSQVEEIQEPWAEVEIISPAEYLSQVMQLINLSRGIVTSTENFSEKNLKIKSEIPLSSIAQNFYDDLKNASRGFASMNYKIIGYRRGDLVKLEILINSEIFAGFSKIVTKEEANKIAEKTLKKLKDLIPRQMIQIILQARIGGTIIARETIKAFRKDVTAKLYGGDRTRKDKLLKKQAKGKKKMFGRANIDIPSDVYVKMVKM